MSKGPTRFREVEVARALRAAARAGRDVDEIHIDRDGQVTLRVAKRQADKTEETAATVTA
jgi:hypothetical protein